MVVGRDYSTDVSNSRLWRACERRGFGHGGVTICKGALWRQDDNATVMFPGVKPEGGDHHWCYGQA